MSHAIIRHAAADWLPLLLRCLLIAPLRQPATDDAMALRAMLRALITPCRYVIVER